MSEAGLTTIRELLAQCSPEERAALFRELRAVHQIHEFEAVIGAPAEMILEAVHRAPELTRRMLRGVIADAAFRTFVVPAVAPHGWQDIAQPNHVRIFQRRPRQNQIAHVHAVVSGLVSPSRPNSRSSSCANRSLLNVVARRRSTKKWSADTRSKIARSNFSKPMSATRRSNSPLNPATRAA